MSTLIQAVKSVIQLSMVGLPASSVPVVLLAGSTAFDRGAIAAMSLKAQKKLLGKAKQCLTLGLPKLSSRYLTLWKKERAAYSILITL